MDHHCRHQDCLHHTEAKLLVPKLIRRWGEGGAAYDLPALARGFVLGGYEMSLASSLPAVTALGPQYVAITDGRHWLSPTAFGKKVLPPGSAANHPEGCQALFVHM
jgi:hypothetical protein